MFKEECSESWMSLWGMASPPIIFKMIFKGMVLPQALAFWTKRNRNQRQEEGLWAFNFVQKNKQVEMATQL